MPPFRRYDRLLALKVSTSHECVDEFLEEERISLRPLYDVPAQQRQGGVAAEVVLHQDRRLCRQQRAHVDLSIMRSLHQGRRKSRPEIHDQKCCGAYNCVGQSFDELFACGVDPMQIFDDDNRSGLQWRVRQ